MAITLRGTADGGNNVGGTFSVTLPGGTAQNDVVYVGEGATINSNPNLAPTTADYVELCDLNSNETTQDSNLGVFRKVQGATPDTTIDFPAIAGSHNAACIVLTGVDTGTPEDATTTTATAIDDAVPNPPAITTVTANAWVIAFGHSTEADLASAPTNYSNLEERREGNSNIMLATREIASAGTNEDPGTFGGISGQTSDAWCAATVCVRPSSGAAAASLVFNPTIPAFMAAALMR